MRFSGKNGVHTRRENPGYAYICLLRNLLNDALTLIILYFFWLKLNVRRSQIHSAAGIQDLRMSESAIKSQNDENQRQRIIESIVTVKRPFRSFLENFHCIAQLLANVSSDSNDRLVRKTSTQEKQQ